MPQFLGQNPDEVDSFASLLAADAADLERVLTEISARLRDTTWVGSDRTKFESRWLGAHAPQLEQLAQSLRDASSIAASNAAGQRSETDELYR